jgi:hypothetical protein
MTNGHCCCQWLICLMEVPTNSKVPSDFGASITDFMKSNCSLIKEVIVQILDFPVFVRLRYMKQNFIIGQRLCL